MTDTPAETNFLLNLQGRAWDGPSGEAKERYFRIRGMKLEMIDGKLLLNDKDRLLLAGLLLENLGAAAIVRLGDADVWKQAVAKLD